MERSGDTKPSKFFQAFSTVIFLLVIGISISISLYIALSPDVPETYTGFYVLGLDGTTDTYPFEITVGDRNSVILGIENHEDGPGEYTIEAFLLEETKLLEIYPPITFQMDLLDRWSVPVQPGQTQEMVYSFTVENQSMNKLVFLLFRDSVPGDLITGQDRINASYRYLQLWITVSNQTSLAGGG